MTEVSAEVSSEEVVVRLTTNDEASVTVCREDDRRPGDLVVVRTHRMPIRACDRHGEEVADRDVDRELRLELEDVT